MYVENLDYVGFDYFTTSNKTITMCKYHYQTFVNNMVIGIHQLI